MDTSILDGLTRRSAGNSGESGPADAARRLILGTVRADLARPEPEPKVVHEFGKNQTRPEGDTRSAKEILESDPLAKNLGDQKGPDEDKSLKERLRDQVGDFENDPDAAFRLVQVLHFVEQYDESGKPIAGKDAGNGKIDGYTKGGEAKHGTEAGRLQDFGKYGYDHLQGDKSTFDTPKPPPAERPVVTGFGPDMTRPEGDKRSAQDIIHDEPLLANLGNQSGVRDMLKKQVGDFEHDADAAYRAVQVLKHIEQFDADGKRLEGGDIGNGKVDGFTKGGEAQHGTEAGRLQDFGKYGWDSLKGDPSLVRENDEVPLLPLAGDKRPPDDHRSAEQIINDSPLLKNLGNQEKVHDKLKDQVGDFQHDPDAAWRAVQVLNYIEKVDGKGKPLKGDDIGNGRVDGFTKGGDAKHDTEAGRLKDFVEQGYSALKDENGSAEDLLAKLYDKALDDAVKEAGGDSKKVTDAYFKGEHVDLSAADKVAALVKLQKGLAQYKSSIEAFDGKADHRTDGYKTDSHYLSNEAFYEDVQKRIDTLSKDPDVKDFLNTKANETLHRDVQDDPKLKAELERRMEAASSEQALEQAFARKDKDGKPVSPAEAVTGFLAGADTYAQLLGQEPDLKPAFAHAPKELQEQVRQAYESVVSGEKMKAEIASGVDPQQALVHSAADKAAFDAVLDEKTVAEGTTRFNDQMSSVAIGELSKGLTPDDLLAALGVKDENDPKFEELIAKNLDAITLPGDKPPHGSDVIATVRRVLDLVRHGATFDGAMKELGKDLRLVPGADTAAKYGTLHAASALLMGGLIAARSGDGSTTNTLQDVGQALSAGSLLSGAFYKFNKAGSEQTWDNKFIFGSEEIEQKFKDVKAGLGTMGIAGDVIGLVFGSISAKDSAEKGDKLSAGFQGTFAALDGISSVAGLAELGAYLLPRLTTPLAAELTTQIGAALGAVAGAVGAIAGGVAALGGIIYLFVTGLVGQIKIDNAAWDTYSDLKDWFKDVNIDVPSYNMWTESKHDLNEHTK